MIVFIKARKEGMAMLNSVKSVGWLGVASIIKNDQKSVLLNTKDGLNEIQKKFLKIKELITTVIRKRFWRGCVNHVKKMDIEAQKPIAKEIDTKSIVTILWLWLLNWVISKSPIIVKNVKTIVAHKLITMIIPNLWTLFGCVVHVMVKSIGYIYQRERLNLRTPIKGDAIVQTTEETCRGEFEAVPPPSNWSVGKLLLKVIVWLRHTAGCSFYQGQCITNDLWIQNLRSTGI